MWQLKNPFKERMEGGNTGVVMGFLPEDARNHLVAWLAEFAGTFLFLFFSFSIATVANTPPAPADSHPLPDVSKLLYIALGFGCSVAINVWIFYRISGGQLNPAVTLTLWLVGAVPAIRCLVIATAQILGGIAAAGISSALLPGPFPVNVRLGGGTSVVRGLFIEMFTTTMLVMTVIMLAAVKSKSTWLAPIGIGIALFIGHLMSIYYTGAGINPARAFGPDVVTGSFPGYHWIYWVGPFLGSLLASSFWYMFESLGWKTVNPGQDYDDLETQAINPKMQTLRPNVYVSRRDPEAANSTSTSGSPLIPRANGESEMRSNNHNNNEGNTGSNYYYEQQASNQVSDPATRLEPHQASCTNGQDSEKLARPS